MAEGKSFRRQQPQPDVVNPIKTKTRRVRTGGFSLIIMSQQDCLDESELRGSNSDCNRKHAGSREKTQGFPLSESFGPASWQHFVAERERVARCEFARAKLTADGCIELPSEPKKNGSPTYPHVTIEGHLVQASRAMYELLNGAVPAETIICHSCDNTRCINPCHLIAADAQANMMDMVEKEHGAHQKLKNEDVLAMRDMREEGTPFLELAELFGVSMATINDVCCGHTWKHLPVKRRAH